MFVTLFLLQISRFYRLGQYDEVIKIGKNLSMICNFFAILFCVLNELLTNKKEKKNWKLIKMFNSDLFCNYKKCHKLLTTFAWVTSCSHVFCEEHGNKAFEQDKKCPACGLDLCKDYDVVKTNLNPSEEFKSVSFICISEVFCVFDLHIDKDMNFYIFL